MVILGDLNFPRILWDSIDSVSGVNELSFIKTLHDHLLTQLNKKPLVATTYCNHERAEPCQCNRHIVAKRYGRFYTDHSGIIFQFNAFIPAPPKTLRFVDDYTKADFDGNKNATKQ